LIENKKKNYQLKNPVNKVANTSSSNYYECQRCKALSHAPKYKEKEKKGKEEKRKVFTLSARIVASCFSFFPWVLSGVAFTAEHEIWSKLTFMNLQLKGHDNIKNY
jgi:hypothetical protein